MSRKTGSGSNNGFGDVIGVALLAIALLLLVAQLSFDRYDLSFFRDPHNKPVHNWIGVLGAYVAWGSFLPFGWVGYVLPWLLALFGVAYLLNFMSYLHERLRWSLLWAVWAASWGASRARDSRISSKFVRMSSWVESNATSWELAANAAICTRTV